MSNTIIFIEDEYNDRNIFSIRLQHFTQHLDNQLFKNFNMKNLNSVLLCQVWI